MIGPAGSPEKQKAAVGPHGVSRRRVIPEWTSEGQKSCLQRHEASHPPTSPYLPSTILNKSTYGSERAFMSNRQLRY